MNSKTQAAPSGRNPPSSAHRPPKSDAFAAGLWVLSTKSLSPRSMSIMRSIWSKACSALHDAGLSLNSADHLFWESHALSRSQKEHSLRLLRLVEDVYSAYSRGMDDRAVNPGGQAIASLLTRAEPRNSPSFFLAPREVERVKNSLSPLPSDDLARLRDKAMAGLALGAGASPAELIATAVSCVPPAEGSPMRFVAETTFSGVKAVRSRSVCPEPWTAHLLAAFAEARGGEPTDPAFTRTDRHSTRPMERTRVFRQIRSILEEALPVKTTRLGPQTLRNSWVAGLFLAGAPDSSVAELAGWADTGTAARMRRAWMRFEEIDKVIRPSEW